MTRTAILLRAVNLGSRNQLSMPEVRRRLEAHGYQDVVTYLRSGNVVAAGDVAAGDIAELLGVDVITRSHAELREIVDGNPFPQHADEPAKLAVAFCDRAPIGSIPPDAYAPDEFIVKTKNIFLWYPQGQGRSKMGPGFGKKLGVMTTVRNWNTVRKLLELTGPDR